MRCLEREKQVNKNKMHEMKWIRSWTRLHAHGMSSEGEREDRLIVPELLSELALNNIGKPGQCVPSSTAEAAGRQTLKGLFSFREQPSGICLGE